MDDLYLYFALTFLGLICGAVWFILFEVAKIKDEAVTANKIAQDQNWLYAKANGINLPQHEKFAVT